MNIRSIVLVLAVLFYASIVNAQQKRVVVVDGYFTQKDSTYVVDYLGTDYIKEVSHISSDSALVLIGNTGMHGILNIITTNPQSLKSKHFREKENLLFSTSVAYFINGKEVSKMMLETAMRNPAKLISVNTITPLKAAQMYGIEKKGGVVFVKKRE